MAPLPDLDIPFDVSVNRLPRIGKIAPLLGPGPAKRPAHRDAESSCPPDWWGCLAEIAGRGRAGAVLDHAEPRGAHG